MSDLEEEDDSDIEEDDNDLDSDDDAHGEDADQGEAGRKETVADGGDVVLEAAAQVGVNVSKQRTRKISERITKIGLSRQVGGVGSSQDKPLALD